MKLFLSSIRLPNPEEHEILFGSKLSISVVIVPNAWDTYPEERQKLELADTVSQFEGLGYSTSVLDLVTSSNEHIKASLESNDFVWVMGGNSFYLNYRVRSTGFDKHLKTALENGLVYGGTSAGAILVSPTLHGVQNVDDPKETPQVIWEGLGFTDFGIVPHWGMEKYAQALEKMKADMQPYVARLITLTNDQAATVIGGKLSIA